MPSMGEGDAYVSVPMTKDMMMRLAKVMMEHDLTASEVLHTGISWYETHSTTTAPSTVVLE